MSASTISAQAVSFEYGDRTILDEIDLRVHEGDRIALVGSNGSGKSTLLKLLAGIIDPTSGTVTRHGGARVAWLPQVSSSTVAGTVRDELAERIGIGQAEREMDYLTARLSDGDLGVVGDQAAAVERWSALGGGDFDARLGAALQAAGIEAAWADRDCATLSGGQMARVRQAALGLARLDCALLDEPSNHLDSEGLRALSRSIEEAPFAIVMASHDRTMLEEVATTVVELDRTRARTYRGGWQTYLRERAADRRNAEATYEEATAERDRLEALERRVRQQGEAGQRRAKRGKENDKSLRNIYIESAQRNTPASGIRKRIASIDIPEKPWEEALSRLLLDAAQPVHSSVVAGLDQVVLARGDWSTGPIDLRIAPTERILLTGGNGSGKSSLMGVLGGRLAPAAGEINRPAGARITELAQRGGAFDAGRPLVESFVELSGLSGTEARTALAAMRLGADFVSRLASRLSPGEQTRAELALLANQSAACLLLDEPSNHLDIEALDVLELALQGWKGALVIASHDRTMRERVKVDRTVDLEAFAQPTLSRMSSSNPSASSSS